MKSDIKRAIENAPQPVELSSGHILFDKSYMNTWRKDIDKGVIFDGDDRLFKEILSNTKISFAFKILFCISLHQILR